jgi:hypothetical protein
MWQLLGWAGLGVADEHLPHVPLTSNCSPSQKSFWSSGPDKLALDSITLLPRDLYSRTTWGLLLLVVASAVLLLAASVVCCVCIDATGSAGLQ